MNEKNQDQNQAMVPFDFTAVSEQGKISNASARDLSRKHLNKIKCDAKVNEFQRRLELAKRKLEASTEYKKYKELQKQLKLAKRDAEASDHLYMGAVSNGLAGFLPDSSLADKLDYIANETEKMQLTQSAEVE